MVSPTRLLVYGGRGAEGNVLCDVAVFDAKEMKWVAREPTPFPRCAHAAAALASPAAGPASSSGRGADADAAASTAAADAEQGTGAAVGSGAAPRVCVYAFGGFSGEAVEGDLLRIDAGTLEVEQVGY